MRARNLALILLALTGSVVTAAPWGTAFTYQGQLTDGGQSANGSYDLKFTLYGDVSGGTAVAGPITNSPVGVTIAGGGAVSFHGFAHTNRVTAGFGSVGGVAIATLEVLNKVVALPVTTWCDHSQTPSVRHIGPIARTL